MKTEQKGREDRKDRGERQTGSRIDEGQGYLGPHGEGPQGGQAHFGSSARLSDQGSHGRNQRDVGKQELGSHGGARRAHPDKGPSDQ